MRISNFLTSSAVGAILMTTLYGNRAEAAAGPYTPEQAISVMYDELRSILGFDATSNGKYWLSLSMVGALVAAKDVSQVNDLANFCPDPTPVILTYNRVRRLDAIYLKVLNSLTGPLRQHSDDYNKAQALIIGTDGNPTAHYNKYSQYEDAYVKAFSASLKSTDANERDDLQHTMDKARKQWFDFGFKGEIDGAQDVIAADNFFFGGVNQTRRRDVLQHYLDAGLHPGDASGAFKSPLSELSPSIDHWAEEDGWLQANYSDKETSSRYSASSSSSHGFGGLNIGFVMAVGTVEHGGSNESKVSQVLTFSYTFELKRITVRRPWFDSEVFFEPAGWTWKKNPNTAQFPHVAVGVDAVGKPIEAPAATYDNTRLACPLLPTELVIARKRSLTATMSKSDYAKVVESGSSSGGGSLFGIIGGGGGSNWSSTKISEDGSDVTFKVDAPGIAVVGVISEVIPKLPDPNQADSWPPTAWVTP